MSAGRSEKRSSSTAELSFAAGTLPQSESSRSPATPAPAALTRVFMLW